MALLKLSESCIFFFISHIFGPKFEMTPVLWYKKSGLESWKLSFCKLLLLLTGNIHFMILLVHVRSFNILIAKLCEFHSWIETELSFISHVFLVFILLTFIMFDFWDSYHWTESLSLLCEVNLFFHDFYYPGTFKLNDWN